MPGLSSKSFAQIKQRANSAIRSANAILSQSKNTYKKKSSKLSRSLKGKNPFKSMKKKLRKTRGGQRKTMKKRKTTKRKY